MLVVFQARNCPHISIRAASDRPGHLPALKSRKGFRQLFDLRIPAFVIDEEADDGGYAIEFW